MRTILLHCYSGRALFPQILIFPSCLGTKTQWPMPCHGVPWHHPLGKVSPHSGSSNSDYPCHSRFQDSNFMILIRTQTQVQLCIFSSPRYREILTLKDECVKQVRVLTVVWWLLYPCFPLLSQFVTASSVMSLTVSQTWSIIRPRQMEDQPCTHHSHHKGMLFTWVTPSLSQITEKTSKFTILKVPPLSLFLATLLYYLHSTYYYLTLHHLCLKVFSKYLKHNKEHKTIIWKHFLKCTPRTLINFR